MSRRDFLKGLTVVAIGSMIAPVKLSVAAEEEVPELPWPYEELDVEYVRKLGHLGYYAFECAGGSFWAIMTALKEKVGY
ncbi:MAG: twin-arginine translocation signal domain-containing protein, partial [Candidatus Korarchaeota archaeon]|nr:twin-arginine translocation signal domain-containing protein [Candidatus Korarchaeota archaeon]